MGLLEEDLAPSWLRDYGDLEVDVSKLAEFAASLRAEVVDNYLPQLTHLYDDMAAELPGVHETFPELLAFLQTHQASQVATNDLVHFYPEATGRLATAASEISERYGDTDAYSAARLSVVREALTEAGVTTTPPAGPAGTEVG